ncbi:MAG: phosphate transport system substrate-binding protein [Acidobacteriota bacterium]|jgi:outer membrane protein OmpA-like peptidoglycan-associated protein|nr:phosphate transport system substrate-binding protein [Acidobacteriota bacterium]
MQVLCECGSKIEATDRFCRECGVDRKALIAAANLAGGEPGGQQTITATTGEPQSSTPREDSAGERIGAHKAVKSPHDGDGAGGDTGGGKSLDTSEEEDGRRRPNYARLALPVFLLVALALVGAVVWGSYAGPAHREVTLNMRAPKVLGCEPMRKLVREFLKNEGVNESEISETIEQCEKAGELKVSGLIARKATQVTLDVQLCDSSTTVFNDMLSGDCDLGISWRQVSPDENFNLKQGGFGNMLDKDNECVLAHDGIAVIVNDANPLNSISQESLRRIFAREIVMWEQLSSPDNKLSGPIDVYAPSENVEIVEPFRHALGLAQPLKESKGVELFDDYGRVSDSVASNERGIGFVNVVNRGERTKLLWVLKGDKVTPSEGAATYLPFSYPLYLYRSAKADEYAKRFRSFILEGKARKPLEEAHLDPRIPMQTTAPEPKRPRRYEELTEGAAQLDFNCLFEPNASVLKGDSLARIEEWMNARSRPDDKGYKNILILGFASKEGSEAVNKKLSQERAREVAKVVGRYRKPVAVEWFGSDVPLFGSAEDETDEGKSLNRRVEIWLRP